VDSAQLDTTRTLLRHIVATLTYRAAKVLRDAPSEFGGMAFGSSTRPPVRIVAHMADLMEWAHRLARGEYSWTAGGGDDWDIEVARFFEGLSALDRALALDASLSGPVENPAEKLIQGPLADAFTHVGQLAMLRGMAGVPIQPESYARADIVVGRVGIDQTPPRAPFDGDASVRK
jgi:hypothetical protein